MKSLVTMCLLSSAALLARQEPPVVTFNWPLVYELSERLILPKGTVLRADATFDNSPANRFNPDPTAAVRWGDQTWEEMMVGFFDVAIPPHTDPRTVIVKP